MLASGRLHLGDCIWAIAFGPLHLGAYIWVTSQSRKQASLEILEDQTKGRPRFVGDRTLTSLNLCLILRFVLVLLAADRGFIHQAALCDGKHD